MKVNCSSVEAGKANLDLKNIYVILRYKYFSQRQQMFDI